MLRGNASEILAVAGAAGDTKGVDSSQGPMSSTGRNHLNEPDARLAIILRGCAHGRAAHAEARGEQFLSMLRPLNSLKISKR